MLAKRDELSPKSYRAIAGATNFASKGNLSFSSTNLKATPLACCRSLSAVKLVPLVSLFDFKDRV